MRIPTPPITSMGPLDFLPFLIKALVHSPAHRLGGVLVCLPVRSTSCLSSSSVLPQSRGPSMATCMSELMRLWSAPLSRLSSDRHSIVLATQVPTATTLTLTTTVAAAALPDITRTTRTTNITTAKRKSRQFFRIQTIPYLSDLLIFKVFHHDSNINCIITPTLSYPNPNPFPFRFRIMTSTIRLSPSSSCIISPLVQLDYVHVHTFSSCVSFVSYLRCYSR
jgi:hypothetical protein